MDEFASILQKDPNYKGGDIRLLSCEAGAEEIIIAQQLENIINVNAFAPTDVLWIDFDGTQTIGPDQWTNSGKWKIFNPRRNK